MELQSGNLKSALLLLAPGDPCALNGPFFLRKSVIKILFKLSYMYLDSLGNL